MAMDFWAAQKRARSWTALYVALFVILTVLMAASVEFAVRAFSPDYAETSFPAFGILFAALTIIVATFQYLNFRTQGGSFVAKSLGAREVRLTSKDPQEIQLLNIVEEIAIASSMPMPSVYILNKPSINAFAAGLTPSMAAISVTEGALDTLNREELQGVIAHEFGHISNGDMAISMRLAALVMGFFFILFIALRMLRISSLAGDRGKKGGQILVLVSLVFFLAGSVMWFFGSVLKSAVSREREYLADASAVQFTRNPNGIVNALRKIANETVTDMPDNGAYSHLYFDDRTPFSALFHTHPPLKKRIQVLLNRDYIPPEWNIPS